MLWGPRFYRIVLVFLLLALAFPQPVIASPSASMTVHFDIVSVKRNVLVTIRTKDFPHFTKFTARMDLATNKGQGAKGPVVGEFTSGKDSIFEQTFNIPETLKDGIILGLRFDSPDGYNAYNWFFNQDASLSLPDPKQQPSVDFSEVKKNTSATIEAKNLPANTTFWVRVGPFESFYNKYTFMDMVKTGEDGSVKFPLQVPAALKDAENIMVRLDGGGKYAFNVYKNVDGGKAVPLAELYKVVDCQILSINPIPPQDPRGDFDVVWVVQNTGLADWDAHHVIFKYYGGEKMHKYDDVQTLPYDIKRGKVHEFVLDMRAPETPGWHKETWLIAQVANGDKNLCKLSVSVFVK